MLVTSSSDGSVPLKRALAYLLHMFIPSPLIAFPPHLYGGEGDDDAELPPA